MSGAETWTASTQKWAHGASYVGVPCNLNNSDNKNNNNRNTCKIVIVLLVVITVLNLFATMSGSTAKAVLGPGNHTGSSPQVEESMRSALYAENV